MKPGLKPNKTLSVLGERYFDPADLSDEIWKTIPSKFGRCNSGLYQVSNKGRVRNSTNSILGGHIDSCGYHLVALFDSGKTRSYFVHQLVLLVFEGDPPSNMINPTAQHKNHNKLDNRLENLLWMSAEDNNRDGHATKIHMLDTDEYFDSRVLASLSIGRWDGYISECMYLDKPVLDDQNNVVNFEYQSLNNAEWIKYEPSKPIQNLPKKCYIVDKFGETEFVSMCHADRYLGHYEGYIQYRYKRNKPIYNSEGEQVSIKFI